MQQRQQRAAKETAAKDGAAKETATAQKPDAAEAAKRAQQQNGCRRGPVAMGGFTALHFAAREGSMDAVQALVESGAECETSPAPPDKTTAMTLGITNGHLDVGKYLLDHGTDPKLLNTDGLSALFATVDAKWVNKVPGIPRALPVDQE